MPPRSRGDCVPFRRHRWIAESIRDGNADLAGALITSHIRAARDTPPGEARGWGTGRFGNCIQENAGHDTPAMAAERQGAGASAKGLSEILIPAPDIPVAGCHDGLSALLAKQAGLRRSNPFLVLQSRHPSRCPPRLGSSPWRTSRSRRAKRRPRDGPAADRRL